MLHSLRSCCFVLALAASGTPWAQAMTGLDLPADKAAHFGLSSVAVEATMKSCQAWQDSASISPWCRGFSSILVLSLGVAKEIVDQKQGRSFDQQDLSADILGVLTGNLLQWNF